MTEEKNNQDDSQDFSKLLDKEIIEIPKKGDTVKGTVLSASKAEVRLDINGIHTGIVRGPELYSEVEEYANLKPGDEVEATVVEEDNENGEMELSFRYAGHAKVWGKLKDAFKDKSVIKVKITGANRGGLLANVGQIAGFLPVSQLSPENYPRISGGDKTKILEKLKSYIGEEFEVKVVTMEDDGKEEKIVFSEKDVWNEKQKGIITKYKVGTKIEGRITAIADFGVFVSFDENLEGLIHISELAWQRIDDPADLYKVGDKIKAEVISIDGAKIFLSAKKLLKDPWAEVAEKFKIGQVVESKILKVNPFGLFVELDEDIHGLAHISQLNLEAGQKIHDLYKAGEVKQFTIVSIDAKDHRLGLTVGGKKISEKKESSSAKATEDKEKKEKPKKEVNPSATSTGSGQASSGQEKKKEVKKEVKKKAK